MEKRSVRYLKQERRFNVLAARYLIINSESQ